MSAIEKPPGNEMTLALYFKRYGEPYNTECANWADFKKVRLLIRKLGTAEYTKFVMYILPMKTSD